MSETEASSQSELHKVLVVTDDAHLAHVARFGFPTSVTVEVVRDSRDAMMLMENMVPSVVVVDLQTGSAGGIGLAQDMSQDDRLASIPILMLLERAEDEWLAKKGGADLIRTKPLDTVALVRDTLALVER